MSIADKFRCFKCKGVFDKRDDEEWNDEKAREEFKTLYPEVAELPVDTLCGDCNEEFKIWFSQLTDEDKQKMREDAHREKA